MAISQAETTFSESFSRTYARFHKKLVTKTMAIGVILALMGTACLIQLANVQLVNGKSMAQAAAQSRTITVTLKASRGKIMDTNGSILAQSVERYTHHRQSRGGAGLHANNLY